MTTTPSGTRALQPDEQTEAILLSLAYLGPLTLEQLAQLTTIGKRTMQRRLTQGEDGLATRKLISRHEQGSSAAGTVTRGPSAWALTDAGHRSIRTLPQYPRTTLGRDAQYPARPATVRGPSVARHDALVAATLITLIDGARERGGVTGVFAHPEFKVAPTQPAPWADALLAFHHAAPQSGLHPLPWTRDWPTPAQRHQTLLLEVDRDTEPPATISGKAQAYRRVWEAPDWRAWWGRHYGALPSIVWVVPDATRLATVQRCWVDAWPTGSWLLATVDEVAEHRWRWWHQGTLVDARLFPTLASLQPRVAAARPAPPVVPEPQASAAPSVTASPSPSEAPTVPAPALRALPVPPLPVASTVRHRVQPVRLLPTSPSGLWWLGMHRLSSGVGIGAEYAAAMGAQRGGVLPSLLMLVGTAIGGGVLCLLLSAIVVCWLVCRVLQQLARRIWRDAMIVLPNGQVNPRYLVLLARVLLVTIFCGLLPAMLWSWQLTRHDHEAQMPRVIVVKE